MATFISLWHAFTAMTYPRVCMIISFLQHELPWLQDTKAVSWQHYNPFYCIPWPKKPTFWHQICLSVMIICRVIIGSLSLWCRPFWIFASYKNSKNIWKWHPLLNLISMAKGSFKENVDAFIRPVTVISLSHLTVKVMVKLPP